MNFLHNRRSLDPSLSCTWIFCSGLLSSTWIFSCLRSILLMLPSIALLNLISVFFSSRISVCLFVCLRFSHFGFYFSVKLRFYIIEITFRHFPASHCHSVNCQLSLIVYSYTLLSAWFWQCILILSWCNRFLKVLDACFLYLWTLK